MKNINPHANPFIFSAKEVRTATDENGTVWFCAKDVFEALDIEWKGSGYSLRSYPDEWKGALLLRTPGGTQEAVFIQEPAVYRVIFRSQKPEAVAFCNWVCSEVLPALRKQGHFGLVKDADQIKYTNLLMNLLDRLTKTKDAFVYAMLERRLRNLCNAMGEPMPDIGLLGQDKNQLPLI
jgi:prophage antirepressor-like protein